MVNHNVSMSKYDHTTPKRSLGEQAHDVIAPYATLYKLFKEGIPTSMLPDGRTDMETRVYDTYGSATFGTSKLVECFVPLGISGDGMKHKIAIKYAPFRRVSVSCGLSLDDKPAYSELFSSFEAALRLPPDQFALNYLSAGDDHDDATQLPQTIQLSIIQLVSAVRSNLGCWSDEAPILRCLSLMMTTAHSEDILNSTSIFPRFAADAYLDGPVKHWVDPEPPAGVSCTIMMADFVTFMRIYSGHYSLPTCMDRYIVIPFTGHDSEGAELIVRILCYTDTIWWNGRVLMEALVKSAKTKSTHDVLYFAHLASLCKIPNGLGTHDGFKILLVTPNESYASIRLTGPDRKTYRVPRIDPRTSVSLQTKNYTEFEDKDFPNPMTITGLLHSWLAPDNFYTLSWAARTVLNKFLDHNVGSSAQAMIMLAAELFAYVPLEKVINDTNLKSGTHQGFGVFAWELDDPDSKTRLNSSEPISPQIVLKDELKKQGHGTLPDALNWMAHANHTPLGIVNPGKVELNLDFTTHAMNTKISEGDGLYCYTAKEADNISRLATYLGPMIVHSPHRTPLTYSPMQYMQRVSSLLAGIGGWMALSAGYTFFDMARLDSELSWDDAIYNTYIAEPINQVTLGHISFNHNHMRSHVHRVNLPEMIAALPLSDWMMDISAYDGWSLPGWYIAAICKNFSGKDAKVGNDFKILLNPARCTQLGISGRPARAVRMNEETDPMDFLALTTVFDVTELKLACLSPIDGQLKMAYRRFDIYSWLNYRESRMRWKTARGPCPESASYILPRLRYTEGEHGSGIQCEYYVLNTPALVSCGSRTTFMITLNHLDPPTGLFDSYLSNVMSDLSSVAKDLRWADWLEAMPTGTKLAEMLHEHLNGKGDNVGERAKSN